jgi:hypothetical protein
VARSRVELFEQIRRDWRAGGVSIRELPLPAVRDQAARLAGIAARQHATHLAYLAAEPSRA